MQPLTIDNVSTWVCRASGRNPSISQLNLGIIKDSALALDNNQTVEQPSKALIWYGGELVIQVTQVTHYWSNPHILQVQLKVSNTVGTDTFHQTKVFEWNTDPSKPIETGRYETWLEALDKLAKLWGDKLHKSITLFNDRKEYVQTLTSVPNNSPLKKTNGGMVYFRISGERYHYFSELIGEQRVLIAVPKGHIDNYTRTYVLGKKTP